MRSGSRSFKVGLIIVQIAVYVALTLLSRQFVFGQDHLQRPIALFLLLYFAAWASFLPASIAVLRTPEIYSVRLVLTVAFLLRLLLLPSNLIQESDVYRYVLDGQALLHRQNPYQYPARTVEELAEGSFGQALLEPEAQIVLARVSYPDIPTVYPPVAQFAFAAGAMLGGWNWMGQRLIFLLLDLLAIFLLLKLLSLFNKPPVLILLYAWNPLVLKEIINSSHYDVLILVFLALLLISFHRDQERAGTWWIVPGALSLSGAILSKLYPILLLPACTTYLKRKAGERKAFLFVILVLATCIVGFLPFYSVGWEALTKGLREFSGNWLRNAGFFGLLEFVLPYPRAVLTLLLLILATGVPFVNRVQNLERFITSLLWILLIWFLIIPMPYPWYAVPLCGLAILGTSQNVLVTTLVLSGSFGLYYAGFWIEYRNLPSSWETVIRFVEHGAVWVAMLLMWWRGLTGVAELSMSR